MIFIYAYIYTYIHVHLYMHICMHIYVLYIYFSVCIYTCKGTYFNFLK